MKKITHHWTDKLILALLMIPGITISSESAFAQLMPDSTLGKESSTIINNGLKDTVTGGATRGSNLFHSFEKFNVDTGKSVYFANPSNIQNILTRITGNNASNILGTLGVEGTANLFLINPHGIYFGKNASLYLGGSLIVSTAKSIKFVDGTEFSTQVSKQINQPLLTITAPLGLQFTNNPEKIQIESQKGLQIQPNKTLALIGGDINLVGTKLETSGGRIELGSINQESLVNLIPINQGFLMGYDQINNFGNIQLSGGTNIDTSGINAGEIRINTGNLQMIEGAKIISLNQGSLPGGSMIINATNTVELIGTGEFEQGFADILNPTIIHPTDHDHSNGFFALTLGAGNGGNLEMNTGKLILTNGAFIVVSSINQGNGGNININTANSMEINNSLLTTGNRPLSSGNAGNIIINTENLRMENIGIIASSSFGTGKAGNITINATKLMEMIGGTNLIDLSIGTNIHTMLTSETFNISDAGNIQINTQKLIVGNSYILSSSQTGSTGNGGNLTINANNLQLINGGSISGSTSSSGKAGNLIVNASDIEITGINKEDPSGLFARSKIGATGAAGDIQISTNNLKIYDAAAISTSTFGSGNGGNININANTFTINNRGKVLTTTSGSGDAGNINLNIRNSINLDGANTGLFANTEIGSTGKSGSIIIDPILFMIKNGAGVGVNSQGTGQGGSISIKSGMLTLDNQAFINAASASNQGGEITLNINDLLWLRNNSNITATAGTAGTGGNGGNININVPFIIGFANENSDITANAFQGNGGNINITTNTIFGLKFQPKQTELSDITASSELGLSGQVTINRLDVDPARGLATLPANLVDASNQLAQGCNSNGGRIARERNRFSITGKGGLPINPDDLYLLSGTSPMIDLVDISTTKISQNDNKPVVINHQNNQKVNLKNREIQQAQGWVFTDDGKVILTSQTLQVIPQNTSLNNPGCEVFSQ